MIPETAIPERKSIDIYKTCVKIPTRKEPCWKETIKESKSLCSCFFGRDITNVCITSKEEHDMAASTILAKSMAMEIIMNFKDKPEDIQIEDILP